MRSRSITAAGAFAALLAVGACTNRSKDESRASSTNGGDVGSTPGAAGTTGQSGSTVNGSTTAGTMGAGTDAGAASTTGGGAATGGAGTAGGAATGGSATGAAGTTADTTSRKGTIGRKHRP